MSLLLSAQRSLPTLPLFLLVVVLLVGELACLLGEREPSSSQSRSQSHDSPRESVCLSRGHSGHCEPRVVEVVATEEEVAEDDEEGGEAGERGEVGGEEESELEEVPPHMEVQLRQTEVGCQLAQQSQRTRIRDAEVDCSEHRFLHSEELGRGCGGSGRELAKSDSIHAVCIVVFGSDEERDESSGLEVAESEGLGAVEEAVEEVGCDERDVGESGEGAGEVEEPVEESAVESRVEVGVVAEEVGGESVVGEREVADEVVESVSECEDGKVRRGGVGGERGGEERAEGEKGVGAGREGRRSGRVEVGERVEGSGRGSGEEVGRAG